jgi:uncharacterized glyoxalase superfamily protein PhnB
MTDGIRPELWVDRPSEAVAFYEAAFGARILHRVGDGDRRRLQQDQRADLPL